MSNTKLNVLYPRRFNTKDSGEQVHWMKVGVAWMGEKQIDIKLWLAPPANADGEIRLMLREPLPEDDGQRRREPQAPARQYGQQPAQPASPPEDDDQIPF